MLAAKNNNSKRTKITCCGWGRFYLPVVIAKLALTFQWFTLLG